MRLLSWICKALRAPLAALGMVLLLAPALAGPPLETGFAPQQDLTVWPLEISQGYALVRGQVGGLQGVFMLDTGTPWGLLLNRARVSLADTRFVLRGHAGSGQALEVVSAGQAPPVAVHGHTWAGVRNVHAADLGFLEQGTGIGPFLGFIGANFFSNTELTLDYARRVAVVRRVHADTGAPLAALPPDLSGGAVLASVHYRGDNPAFPLFDAMLGRTPVRVMLDSGNASASMDAGWLASLQHAGAAQPFSRLGTATTYRTPALQIGALTVPMHDVIAAGAPAQGAAAVAAQADPPLVKVGHALLSRVGVTWNHRLQTMGFFTP